MMLKQTKTDVVSLQLLAPENKVGRENTLFHLYKNSLYFFMETFGIHPYCGVGT